MMNKDEYRSWISRMHTLGELERLRQVAERADPEGLKTFLFFLDEIHAIWRKTNNPILEDKSATYVRIARQTTLSRYPL